MDMNNNQHLMTLDGLEFVTPLLETGQEVISRYSPIIQNNFEDYQQFSQMNNLMPPISSAAMEESRQFLNNTGTSSDLPNQVTGENTLTPIPRTQNMDSLMNNQDLMKLKTVLVDPAVYSSPSSSSNYLNQNGYMIDANTMFQQGTDNPSSIIGNNLASTRFDGFEFVAPTQETDQEVISPDSPIILNSFENNQQSSQMNNLMPSMSYVAMEESRPSLNNIGTMYLNNLPNQVIGVNTLTIIPRTQNIDSLMSNQDFMKIQTALVDSSVDISPTSNSLNQNGYRVDANAMLQQGTDNPSSIIGNNLASTRSVGVSKCQDAQHISKDSMNKTQSQLLVQNNIHEKNTGVASIIRNTGKQVEVKFMQPKLMAQQQAIPSCSNRKNFEDKCLVPQKKDIKPKNNFSVDVEENKPCPNYISALNSTNLQKQVSPGNPGPLRRTKVGRCPKDETPLYLQPEPQPENKDELKRWRRAKTAYEHRQKKKTTLTGDAKKIEDIIKEMNELKNQIEIVTAEKNTYKSTVDSLIKQNQS